MLGLRILGFDPVEVYEMSCVCQVSIWTCKPQNSTGENRLEKLFMRHKEISWGKYNHRNW